MGWSGNTMNGKVCWFIAVAPDPLIIITVTIGLIPILLVMVLYSIILYHAIANIKQIKYSVSSVYTISEQTDYEDNVRVFRGNRELPIRRVCRRTQKNRNLVPNKWKAIKIVLFTTMSFLITWAPYFVACVLYVAYKCDLETSLEPCKSLKLLIASPLTILGFCNSLVNPIIYAWWHNGFRTYIRKRVKKCCR